MRTGSRSSWVTTGVRTKQAPVGTAEGAEDVRRQMARLDQACHEVGRDPASLDRLVVTGPAVGGPALDSGLASVEAFQEAVGRYAAVGVTDLVVHWPRPDGPFAGDLDTFEHICSSVLAATAHGP